MKLKTRYTVIVYCLRHHEAGVNSITVTINVTDVNEPEFTEGDSATRSIAENTASGVNIGESSLCDTCGQRHVDLHPRWDRCGIV